MGARDENRETTAGDVLIPFSRFVAADEPTASGIMLLQSCDTGVVAVRDPDTLEFVGLVTRDGLESGCRAAGHDPARCLVVDHLLRDFPTRVESDPVPEIRESGGESRTYVVFSEAGDALGYLRTPGNQEGT